MAELTFDQLSPEEKEMVVKFYNSLGQNTGMPLTEATLPRAASLDTGEAVDPPIRSYRDFARASEVSPSIAKDIMTDGPSMDAMQKLQERFGLPRHGVLDEDTFRAMTAHEPFDPPTEAPVTYTIQGGDTLSKIASENTFTLDQLKAANPDITNFNNVMVGQEINLPVKGAPVVEAVETTETFDPPPALDPQAFDSPPVVDVIDLSPEVSTTEEALETAVIDVPEQAIQNPVQYIVDGNLIGLNESAANPTMQETIVGFFKNSLVNSIGWVTTGRGPISVSSNDRAWCAAFVDHVLTNLGLPRVQTFETERGKPVYYGRVRAKQYLKLGEAQTIETAKAGDIVVQKSGSQWHVGFYVGTLTAVPTDTAEQVTPIQEALISAGQELPRFGADGDYGGETKAAVAGYQEEQGLEATGVMDEETYTSLMGVEPQVTYSGFLSLGGNQNNEVNLTAYPMSKLQGIRRVGAVQDLDVETFEAISQDINYAAGIK